MGKKKNQSSSIVAKAQTIPASLQPEYNRYLAQNPKGSESDFMEKRKAVLDRYRQKATPQLFTRTPDGVIQSASLISGADASEINREQSRYIT